MPDQFNSRQWDDNSKILIESGLSKSHRKLMLEKCRFFDLVKDKNTKILDLGCGSGATLKYLAGLGYKELQGLEPDVELAREIPNDVAQVKIGVAEKMPFADRSFEVIFIYGVLHHLKGKEAYLLACQEISRVLKPGGLVFILEPGRYYVFRMIEIISGILGAFSRTFKAFAQTQKEEKAEQHYFLKNHDIIRQSFNRAGFTVMLDKYYLYSWLFTVRKDQ